MGRIQSFRVSRLHLVAVSLLWLAVAVVATPSVTTNDNDNNMESSSSFDRQHNQHPKLRRALQTTVAIPEEYIVVLLPDADPTSVMEDCLYQNGHVHYQYQYALNGFSAQLNPFELTRLLHDDRVLFVEEDQRNQLSDFQFNAPWGLDRIDQDVLPLDGLFGYEHNGAGVNVYILDTGLYQDHEQFENRAACSLDAVMEQNQGGCVDANGHGTHVAGTIGATVFGVAKRANLRSVKVCRSSGDCATSTIVQGLDHVTGKDARIKRVANLSLSGSYSDSFAQAAARAHADGVVVVMAAGNNDSRACYTLGNSEHVITVGAVDEMDIRASFSNYDGCVDIWAPGTDILSTTRTLTGSELRSGTSHSAPLVSGAIAMMMQEGIQPVNALPTLLNRAVTGILSDLQSGSPNILLNIPHNLTLPPTTSPSGVPSSLPTSSLAPTKSAVPSSIPSLRPSIEPSEKPSTTPSLEPSPLPSSLPSSLPSEAPSPSPSNSPSVLDSAQPSISPSFAPTRLPSQVPSISPSVAVTLSPSVAPTLLPKEDSCPNRKQVDGRMCLFSIACRRRCPDYECTDRSILRLFLGTCRARKTDRG